MVVIDATMLLLMLRPDTPVPGDEKGVPIDRPKERIGQLVKDLEKAGTKIIIPTPVLGEVLIRAGATASQEIVEQLEKLSVFRIEPFDVRAAIELAAISRDTPGTKRLNTTATYAKLKYDRQIVAIAKVHGATTIYSDDGNLKPVATRAGLNVIGLADLALPPEDAQYKLVLETKTVATPAQEKADEQTTPPGGG